MAPRQGTTGEATADDGLVIPPEAPQGPVAEVKDWWSEFVARFQDWLFELPANLLSALPTLLTIALVCVALWGANRLLRLWDGGGAKQGFRHELTMLMLTVAGVGVVILSLPVDPSTKGQVLSLYGLLLSAAIALSSTNFLGNMMAGLMLRAVRSFETGDWIQCGEHFGRISERGLLHTELQTPNSELTTLPNLHLATNPYTIVRKRETIVSATLTLGYDVPRTRIEALLSEAAKKAGLETPLVHVLNLGDFSVEYYVGGVCKEVESKLLSKRSDLKKRILDVLHEAGVEIASPTLMNTRAYSTDTLYVPPTQARASEREHDAVSLEELAFEKADQAASVEQLEKRIVESRALLEEAREARKRAKDGAEVTALDTKLRYLELRVDRQVKLLESKREELAKREAEGS